MRELFISLRKYNTRFKGSPKPLKPNERLKNTSCICKFLFYACICMYAYACVCVYRETKFPFLQTQQSRSHLFAFTRNPHNRSGTLVNHRGTKKKRNARRVLWIFHIFSRFAVLLYVIKTSYNSNRKTVPRLHRPTACKPYESTDAGKQLLYVGVG